MRPVGRYTPGSPGSPKPGLVRPTAVLAGDTISKSPRFNIGIDTLAAPELKVPMYAQTSGSCRARRALAASASLVHWPAAAVESSRSRYSIRNGPTLLPTSSIAMRMPRTSVSDCCLALPVRGRLETIFTSVGSAGRQATAQSGPQQKRSPIIQFRAFIVNTVGFLFADRQTCVAAPDRVWRNHHDRDGIKLEPVSD